MNHLLDQGMTLLWSNGYNATSVNDIVKSAEVPKGSFYFYFESKEDFAVKALQRYFAIMMTEANEILEDSSVRPIQRILNLYTYKIKQLKEEMDCKMGCMACNLGNEMAEHSEGIRTVIHENGEMFRNKLAQLIKDAQESGELSIKEEPIKIVEFIEDAGKGAMISMKEKGNAEPIDNVYHMLKNYFLK